MTEERLSLGRWGEEEAAGFLTRQGLRILERNFRAPVGEIDIIALDCKTIVFIEVKTRRSTSFGFPQEAVGRTKQGQIIRTAQWYLGDKKEYSALQPRFDVVSVLKTAKGPQFNHIPDAFGV